MTPPPPKTLPTISSNTATKMKHLSHSSPNRPTPKPPTTPNTPILAIFKKFVIITIPWSRSITVSTSGFHPDNAGSTPAESTIKTPLFPTLSKFYIFYHVKKYVKHILIILFLISIINHTAIKEAYIITGLFIAKAKYLSFKTWPFFGVSM